MAFYGNSLPQMRGSLNTTTGSLKSNKSLNVTSSMSLPNYSVDNEDDQDDVSAFKFIDWRPGFEPTTFGFVGKHVTDWDIYTHVILWGPGLIRPIKGIWSADLSD